MFASGMQLWMKPAGIRGSVYGAKVILQSRMIHLSYTNVPAVGSNKEKPTLVIAHGLFGANQNWRTISKKINQISGNQVLCVDLRNHGDSEHHPSMTFEEMGDDIIDLLQRRNIDKFSLLGHSMGAKVMMALSLREPAAVDRLIAVDSSPVSYAGNPDNVISSYIKAMQSIDLSSLTSRKEADGLIKDVVKSELVRQFLLRNIIQSNEGLVWRMNLDSIARNYEDIMGFPEFEENKFHKPTLFIGGADSNYIREEHTPAIKQYFPQAKITHVAGAGHWVHAERPHEVVRLVSDFIKQ